MPIIKSTQKKKVLNYFRPAILETGVQDRGLSENRALVMAFHCTDKTDIPTQDQVLTKQK